MHTPISLRSDVDLKPYNSFGVAARAKWLAKITHIDDIKQLYDFPELLALPRLVLGGGSNIVLTDSFPGLVIHMQNRGISISASTTTHVKITAAAGEPWNDLVKWTLQRGLGGLENLSLIPGSVGAAPVQNIGAYGAELAHVLDHLVYWDWESRKIVTLTNAQCEFRYRDSRFKSDLADRALILELTLALPKAWQANLSYPELANAFVHIENPNPLDISAAVVAIRERKLPSQNTLGNAGSFFKNPQVTPEQAHTIRLTYPALPIYPQENGMIKLAAGWLIDAAGWKGRHVGTVGVYEHQALVLVNLGGASGADIIYAARAIQDDIKKRFNVALEAEPIFIPAP